MDNNSRKNEDVDLAAFLRGIKMTIVGLWNFLIHTLQLALKRWILMLICIAIGTCIGIGLFKILKPIYASTLVLSSNVLSNEFCADIINNLDILIKDKTPELLAQKLNISLSSARNLKGLEFDNYNEEIKKKYKDKDTIVLGRPFKIKAYSLSPAIFDTLQTALVRYLENNEYSLKRKEVKRENLLKLREKLQDNIHQMDSLKFTIASNLMAHGSQTNIIVSKSGEAPTFNDPLNVFKEGIALYKEELSLNTSLTLIDNIQVIQDFSPRAKPDTTLKTYVLKYAGIWFIIGLILVFILESKQKKLAG